VGGERLLPIRRQHVGGRDGASPGLLNKPCERQRVYFLFFIREGRRIDCWQCIDLRLTLPLFACTAA
jgi:hypothetical protein